MLDWIIVNRCYFGNYFIFITDITVYGTFVIISIYTIAIIVITTFLLLFKLLLILLILSKRLSLNAGM